MGPVKLNSSTGVSRDFYKDEVNPVLDRCFAHRNVATATTIMMIDREDEADIREALLAVCAQFIKPERVIVLCRPSVREVLERLAKFFGAFVQILVVCPDEETARARRHPFGLRREAVRDPPRRRHCFCTACSCLGCWSAADSFFFVAR
jgi:hypothetical protein